MGKKYKFCKIKHKSMSHKLTRYLPETETKKAYVEKKHVGEKSIMSDKDLDEYLKEMVEYTEMISKEEVPSEDSLYSLVSAGICDKNKNLNEMYLMV